MIRQLILVISFGIGTNLYAAEALPLDSIYEGDEKENVPSCDIHDIPGYEKCSPKLQRMLKEFHTMKLGKYAMDLIKDDEVTVKAKEIMCIIKHETLVGEHRTRLKEYVFNQYFGEKPCAFQKTPQRMKYSMALKSPLRNKLSPVREIIQSFNKDIKSWVPNFGYDLQHIIERHLFKSQEDLESVLYHMNYMITNSKTGVISAVVAYYEEEVVSRRRKTIFPINEQERELFKYVEYALDGRSGDPLFFRHKYSILFKDSGKPYFIELLMRGNTVDSAYPLLAVVDLTDKTEETVSISTGHKPTMESVVLFNKENILSCICEENIKYYDGSQNIVVLELPYYIQPQLKGFSKEIPIQGVCVFVQPKDLSSELQKFMHEKFTIPKPKVVRRLFTDDSAAAAAAAD